MEEYYVKKEILQELFNKNKIDNKFKLSKNGLVCWQEYIRLMTVEAIHRAHDEAIKEGSDEDIVLDVQHLEKIIYQLFLDF
ncbi:hypothetical protein K502DRAFT_366160 [Neoconidiobolus thromboides FSU 785]|nr:hypothetical protein K502DRAFT_366160 [Neoconidiobolus thromboides FSU 785]